MKNLSTQKVQNCFTSNLERFQLEKSIKDLFLSEVGAEIIHPEWQRGSVVMYYDSEEGNVFIGVIRRIDKAVVTVQNCSSGRFETVPLTFVEKIPRGKLSRSNLRRRTNPPATFYAPGEMCATVTKTGALEIGVLEVKTEKHCVLLCNGQRFTVPQGKYWRAIGVELELGIHEPSTEGTLLN